MKVKDMRSLWEKRENKNIDSQKVKFKRTKETNTGARQASPVPLRSMGTVSSQASDVVNDGGEGSGESPKPAKVSELVGLWNKF
jgi:hypothetical protein